jgi:hypothetical protein
VGTCALVLALLAGGDVRAAVPAWAADSLFAAPCADAAPTSIVPQAALGPAAGLIGGEGSDADALQATRLSVDPPTAPATSTELGGRPLAECLAPHVAWFDAPSSPGFQRSLGRFGPVPPPMPGTATAHGAPWDAGGPVGGLGCSSNAACGAPPHDAAACDADYSPGDFSPDPRIGCTTWDGYSGQSVYANKHLNCTQRPWFECFTPLYEPGPWPPSYTWFGPTNLARPKFYVYGDFRTAVASNNNVANAQTVWANRLNLDIDLWLTATERFHAFWGPLDEGQQFTSVVFDDSGMEVEDHLDGWDETTDAAYFEGDVGAILGGFNGIYSPFDLPFAVGLIPLVFQNGIWLEDSFVGAAATIPARNSPGLDISNFDTTLFVGFEELTTDAFGVQDDDAKFVGVTTFIERRGGYLELGWAYVDDPTNQGLGYNNIGLSYTRRYLNLVSNSARLIANVGQDGPQDQRTADGYLVILENSLLTPMPYNVIPYVNVFAGFDRPQSLGRLQGPLKNTGINFESDTLTNYPFLDDSGNDTYGGALGLDLLGGCFDRQLIVEAAMVQAFGNPATRIAPGDEYAVGVRYQKKLNNSLIFRADAMHGWIENSNDVDGARVELRHKF